MSSHVALIVDDEPDIRELVTITLERMGVSCDEADCLAVARGKLADVSYDLCLTDMRLPDGSGIELVREMQSRPDQIPVAVITAHGNVELAVQALKAGAFDFVSKPVELQTLRTLVATALRLERGSTDNEAEADAALATRLIGDAPSVRDLRLRISKLARSQAPVYISGESGVGKELVAHMIHAEGPRASAPFVPVNCGAISPDLIESELFGHKRGSFTGAHADNPGLFQAANGGTLFLDEVAELPLPMQVKLLRAIQEKSVRPVGASSELPVDVRILSATHKDLGALVQRGDFRQDLYYRVNVIELKVPALRERTEDIADLAHHLLDRAALGEVVPKLAADALAALQAHPFPGNVRELENILMRAMTLCEGGVITVDDLGLPIALPFAAAQSDTRIGMAFGRQSLDEYLAEVEIDTIQTALDRAHGNKTRAARLLGLKLGALRYRLMKLEME